MLYMKSITIKSSFRIPLWLMLTIISSVFCSPNVVSSAQRYYYYLHISSFRLNKRAVQDVERLRNKGYNAITRRERVPNMGYWYRVYIGPFSSLREAKLKRKELRKKRLVEYVAIHKKGSLISGELGKPPEIEKRKAPIEVKAAAPKINLPQQLTPTVPEEPVEVPPAPEKPPEAKEVPVPIPPMEERQEVKAPLPTAPTRPPAKISAKPPRKTVEFPPKRNGRNMGWGDFSLGLRHTSREVEPDITKRKQITSDGTTTSIEDISVAGVGTSDLPTALHIDSLHLRFGLTDYLEVFAEIGAAYGELSDLAFAYGGGLRLNLFEVKGGRFRGFYGGLQGEYLNGGFEEDYTSSTGNKWKKDADWQEFVAKGELGVARSW
ncbi:MAG: SPOR domain-containing protein, partial [Deltaproteobacteria bacterium]